MDFNVLNNSIGYVCLILEIFAILWDCWQGYVIAAILTLVLIILNGKVLLELIKGLMSKMKKMLKKGKN